MIQDRVIREFHEELQRAKIPGYTSRYDDFDPEDSLAGPHQAVKASRREPPEEPALTCKFAPRRLSSTQVNHIQPPEPHPRAPHSQPAPQSQGARQPASNADRRGPLPAADFPARGGFGEGIFYARMGRI